MTASSYVARRPGRSIFVDARHLRHHVLAWGDPADARPERPVLVMLHGWMDVAASFQFVVDALDTERAVLALDWRGFGLSQSPAADAYWYPDYLGDLEAVLDALLPGQAIDLLGHSMGGNAAMLYAGIRSQRVRRLVNLEGFGMPATRPEQAPRRYAQWLDELKAPARLRSYPSAEAVADRLIKTNPRLAPDKAAWLATQWSAPAADGQWHLLADPAHKRVNPVLYRADEVIEIWRRIAAPLLWVEGADTDVSKWWGDRYPRSEFEARLAVVAQVERETLADCGHMLHHDQPERLAGLLEHFLG